MIKPPRKYPQYPIPRPISNDFLDRSRTNAYDLPPRLKRQQQQEKIVTIAAGFKCSDGIVICADSEESNQNFKRRVVKIEVRPTEPPANATDPVVIFTGTSGESVFMDELIDKIWNGIVDGPDKSLKGICATIEAANRYYHSLIWGCFPVGTSRSELPYADLIMAVWTFDGYGLYETRNATFRRASEDFTTVGAGEEIAHFICDAAHRSIVNCAKASILGNYMLSKVKDHVPGCGGPSRIAILTSNGGTTMLDRGTIDRLTQQLTASESLVRQILLTSADLDQPDALLSAVMQYCEREMKKLRQQAREEVEKYENAQKWIRDEIHKAQTQRIQ